MLRVVALDQPAARRVEVRGRQRQAGVLGQRINRLDQALAESVVAENPGRGHDPAERRPRFPRPKPNSGSPARRSDNRSRCCRDGRHRASPARTRPRCDTIVWPFCRNRSATATPSFSRPPGFSRRSRIRPLTFCSPRRLKFSSTSRLVFSLNDWMSRYMMPGLDPERIFDALARDLVADDVENKRLFRAFARDHAPEPACRADLSAGRRLRWWSDCRCVLSLTSRMTSPGRMPAL